MLSWDQSSNIARMRQERAWVEVNLTALAHNVQQVRRWLAPTTDLMAVVKADAYGHGAVTVAETALATGATWLGVATIPEGIELREAGITAPILLLGATYTPEQVKTIVRWQLQPTLCTPKQALVFSETMAAMAHRPDLPVHLKLDTGMSRLGTPWPEARAFIQLVKRLPHLPIASIYSHLATADDPDPMVMRLQQQRFDRICQEAVAVCGQPLRCHLANSAATLADANLHYDMVRTGLVIYGLYPAEHLRDRVELHPVLQVKARVTQVKTLQPGTGVSYGHRFITDRPTQMAVVGIGYADGVPRLLSNQMTVLVRGQRVPQIGSITMDQLMLDVSAIPDLQAGEVVTLLGQDGTEHITADEWANTIGTISWEILCGFKHRLPRIAIEVGEQSSLISQTH
jgi:alanine racemase